MPQPEKIIQQTLENLFETEGERNRYFNATANKYERVRSINDSIVRLGQERDISDDLSSEKPVLIRGNWRTGKISMLRSLETHHFRENTIYIDSSVEIVEKDDNFEMNFGLYKIAEFIAKLENLDYEKEQDIMSEIRNGNKNPIKFLNDFLLEKGLVIFLAIDEIIRYMDEPDKLRYFAGLKNFTQIKLAMVLHRWAEKENEFEEIFADYRTYFIKALSLDEVAKLVRKPLKDTYITFTDEAIGEIMQLTGGRPMEINNLCYGLMGVYSGITDIKLKYEAEDIKNVANKTTQELFGTFEMAINNYTRIYKYSMSEKERDFIDRLVKGEEIQTKDVILKIVRPIIDTTFVKEDSERGIYVINGDLFKKVISGLSNE